MFAFGHVFNRQSFLFLLDLEIKKAQRYQNFLSLLSLTFDHLSSSLTENPTVSLTTMGNLLKDELRDTDVIGQGGTNRLFVMLPYADVGGAKKVRKRVEQILRDFGFGPKGFAVEIDEVCFPTHATSIEDLLRVAGNHLSQHAPQ